ncbi:transporter [Novosphingobium sp. KCTC 2891]|uniref:transporter n=1 Tax=Novosphingobium sp. KCTC 2891 TaxID=2989730 RepID=UPI0022235DD8|nr:transporter [Novosphingobium sp. KCTC 2891]
MTGLALAVPAHAESASDAATANTEGQDTVQAPANTLGHTGGLFGDSSLELATGADYSTGHYGASSDTTVWSIPVDLKAQLGRLRVQASLPYEFIDGPGQLVGGVIVSSPDGATTSRSGIGDLNLSAAYLLTRENGLLPAIEFGGGVKLPTAKTTLGTGKTDYSVNASLYKTVAPGAMLFGSIGYSWLGSPAAYRLRNGLTASGGINFRPASNQNYGVSVAYREPVADGLKGQAVVSPYMTYRFSKLVGLTLYGVAGLNDASPRIGAGIRLTVFQ